MSSFLLLFSAYIINSDAINCGSSTPCGPCTNLSGNDQCILDCVDGNDDCNRNTLTCTNGFPCVVSCLGYDSCYYGTLDAEQATSLTLNCGQSGSTDSIGDCWGLQINAELVTNVTVNCIGTNRDSCKQMTLNCGTGICHIECQGDSCAEVNVDASLSTQYLCTGDGCNNVGIITSNPTTAHPTSNPTTNEPTTSQPTTANPTTFQPTTRNPTKNPTTLQPTANPIDNPTTSTPITVIPTTTIPTTVEPTTSNPSTAIPTTSDPTTSIPTTSNPTTFLPTTANLIITIPTAVPTTAIPTTTIPTTTPTIPAISRTIPSPGTWSDDYDNDTTTIIYVIIAAISCGLIIMLCLFIYCKIKKTDTSKAIELINVDKESAMQSNIGKEDDNGKTIESMNDKMEENKIVKDIENDSDENMYINKSTDETIIGGNECNLNDNNNKNINGENHENEMVQNKYEIIDSDVGDEDNDGDVEEMYMNNNVNETTTGGTETIENDTTSGNV